MAPWASSCCRDVRPVVKELSCRAVYRLCEAAPEGVGEARQGPGLLQADEAITRVPGKAGRLGAVREGRQVAVGVKDHLVGAEGTLAVGRVVGGARDRRRQERAGEAAANRRGGSGGEARGK